MNDLEAAPVAELIAELLRRTTFRGVVAWQAESFKGTLDTGWQWRSSNCDAALSFQELAEKVRPCQ